MLSYHQLKHFSYDVLFCRSGDVRLLLAKSRVYNLSSVYTHWKNALKPHLVLSRVNLSADAWPALPGAGRSRAAISVNNIAQLVLEIQQHMEQNDLRRRTVTDCRRQGNVSGKWGPGKSSRRHRDPGGAYGSRHSAVLSSNLARPQSRRRISESGPDLYAKGGKRQDRPRLCSARL